MSNQKHTLRLISEHIALFFSPLKESFSNVASFQNLLTQLGWNVSDLPAEYTQIISNIDQAIDAIENLADDPSLEEIVSSLELSSNIYESINNISNAPIGIDVPSQFLNELPQQLTEFLLIDYLSDNFPSAYNWLIVLGIIKFERIVPPGNRPAFLRKSFLWSQIPELISNPLLFVELVYGWGTTDLKFDVILEQLASLLVSLDFLNLRISDVDKQKRAALLNGGEDVDAAHGKMMEFSLFHIPVGDTVSEVGLGLYELPVLPGSNPGIVVQPILPSELTQTFDLSSALKFELRANTDILDQFAIMIGPDGLDVRYPFQPGKKLPGAGMGLGFTYNVGSETIIFGGPNSTRLSFDKACFGLDINVRNSEFELKLYAGLPDLRLIIKGGDGDGFISKILGDSEYLINFPANLAWSSVSGLQFEGGGGFEIDFNPHLDFGFLNIKRIGLGINAITSGSPGVQLLVDTDIDGALGPISYTIQEIGFSNRLLIEDGNAGPLDIALGFNPPKGIGIQVDASVVKGGGFLYIDTEKGEYAGVAELTIQSTISLKAIGIINTKLPNGEEGFAFLLLITAEFMPIQLGYGFTLNGVGGLIGVNRGMNLTAIRDGVRNDTLDHILFPDDPVANAPAIIANLNSVFPIAEGNHSFGIMGIIGWGVPTLLEVELGLMITFPSFDLAVIGKVSTALPDKAAAILTLNVAFAGTMSFEKKYFYFDAAIFDSKLLTFSLSGQMALRLLWGDEPNFVLSVGGFNPDFVPPPLELNSLERITLNLLADDNPRLTLKTYFAVTSNTVQFGASIDFLFKVSKFKVVGYFYFHALFQFDPFYFKISIGAGLDVKLGSSTILSVSVSGSLEGPTPWKIKGKGKFKIWFVKFSVSFSETWGESRDTALPGIEVFPKLRESILDDRNWSALLPKNSTLTTLREIPEEELTDHFTIHPFGSLSMLQRIVPLKETIALFGNQEPSDYKRFELSLSIDGNAVDATEKKDYFAPAQFFDLTDAQKISKNAYVKYRAGLAAKTTEDLSANHHVNRVVEYEIEVLDSKDLPPKKGVYVQTAAQMAHWAKGSAIAKSELGFIAEQQQFESGKDIVLNNETFVIVNQSDLSLVADVFPGTELELQTMLDDIVLESPEMESELMVVSSYEIL